MGPAWFEIEVVEVEVEVEVALGGSSGARMVWGYGSGVWLVHATHGPSLSFWCFFQAVATI